MHIIRKGDEKRERAKDFLCHKSTLNLEMYFLCMNVVDSEREKDYYTKREKKKK